MARDTCRQSDRTAGARPYRGRVLDRNQSRIVGAVRLHECTADNQEWTLRGVHGDEAAQRAAAAHVHGAGIVPRVLPAVPVLHDAVQKDLTEHVRVRLVLPVRLRDIGVSKLAGRPNEPSAGVASSAPDRVRRSCPAGSSAPPPRPRDRDPSRRCARRETCGDSLDRFQIERLGSPSSAFERQVLRIGVRHRRPRPAGHRCHVAHARQPSVLLEAAQLTDRRRRRSRASTGKRDADIELPHSTSFSRSGTVSAGVVSFQNVGLISQYLASTQPAHAAGDCADTTAPTSTAQPRTPTRSLRLIASPSSDRCPRRRTSGCCPDRR